MKPAEKYNIPAADLYKLDNVKCELHALINRLEDVVQKDVLKVISNATKAIDRVVGPLVSADEKAEVARREQVNKLGLETKSSPARYSCNVNPQTVIFNGMVVFEHTGAWVQPGKQRYKSAPIANPTYADAFRAFQEAIETTGDTHHVFFEGVSVLALMKGRKHVDICAGS